MSSARPEKYDDAYDDTRHYLLIGVTGHPTQKYFRKASLPKVYLKWIEHKARAF